MSCSAISMIPIDSPALMLPGYAASSYRRYSVRGERRTCTRETLLPLPVIERIQGLSSHSGPMSSPARNRAISSRSSSTSYSASVSRRNAVRSKVSKRRPNSSPLSTEVLLKNSGRNHDGCLALGQVELCHPFRVGDYVTLHDVVLGVFRAPQGRARAVLAVR